MEKSVAWDRFTGNSPVKRALEVALAGEHMIGVFGNLRNGKDLLQVIMGDKIQFISLCPCGVLGDWQLSCICTEAKIVTYRSTKKYQKVLRSEIVVEVLRPRDTDYERKEESYETMYSRIGKMESICFVQEKICSDGKAILKLAINKLGFTIEEVNQVKSVSGTIARLEGVCERKASHIAEAIQYKTFGVGCKKLIEK